MSSSYQVLLWKQESLLVLMAPKTPEIPRPLLFGAKSTLNYNETRMKFARKCLLRFTGCVAVLTLICFADNKQKEAADLSNGALKTAF